MVANAFENDVPGISEKSPLPGDCQHPLSGKRWTLLRGWNGKFWLSIGFSATWSACAWGQGHVNIYGIVDAYINTVKTGSTRLTRLENGANAASRIGFRGSEDLGAGLQAHFVLEAGMAPDTGAGTIPGPGLAFTRQALVGLKGHWGSLELGHMYTPMYAHLARIDSFAMNPLFSPLNLVAVTDAQPGQRPLAARASNQVRYRTPDSQPWVVDAGYAFGENPAPNGNKGRLYGATLGWNRKPFFLAYSLQKAVDAVPASAPNTTSQYQAILASWEATPELRLSGSFIDGRVDRQGTGRARIMQLGAEYSLAPASRLMAAVAQRKVDGSDRGQTAWTLGYDHALSKRTALYARWLYLGNSSQASATIGNVPVAANSGDSLRSLALGVRHNF